MPGPSFHLEVLRLTQQALAGGSAAERARAKLLADHAPHARLGALGPDLLRYRPLAKAALDTLLDTPDLNALDSAAKQALYKQVYPNPEMALYGALYRELVPHYPEFDALDAFLQKMAGIAAAEDTDALKDVKDEFDAVKAQVDALQSLADSGRAIKNAGGFAITAARPAIQIANPNLSSAWRPFEFMRWRRTGAFARALVKRAQSSGDDALKAYAAGWLSHIAGAVVGEPFVNSIVGGPYRTHWWRNKWARNHVDGWVWGRYQTPATMAGDTPTPAYADWHSLCRAELQDQVRLDPIAGADAATAVTTGAQPPTPAFDKVAQLLAAAAGDTYGDRPALMPPELTELGALRGAYVGALSVLWFMTGASPLTPQPPGAPPAGAETPPSWYTDGGSPPSPTTGGSSSGSTASAIIAIILAVIAIATGCLLAGIGAIALAIAAALAGDPVDWASLRSTIYWMQVRLFDAENAIHKALLRAGAAYPQHQELGTAPSPTTPAWTPVSDSTPDGPVALTRSRRSQSYPQWIDDRLQATPALPADLSFTTTPQSAQENPATRVGFDLAAYADRIIDGKGLLNGGLVTDNGQFPTRDQDFGDAVSNAVALLNSDAQTLADYNLDGDRGYGWKTWHVRPGATMDDPDTGVDAREDA